MMNVTRFISNPLAQTGSTGSFLRLVLAEAGAYGMPGTVIAVIDDIAAMLGFYDPTPRSQTAYLAGPLVNWRSDPRQPTMDRTHDVEALAFKQRALIAFGGGEPGQMVGPAEIVVAMGNLISNEMPKAYWKLYQWATLHTLSTLYGISIAEVMKDPDKAGWPVIGDDDVLKPGGSLYETYQEVTTSLRRASIAALENAPEHPRVFLEPLARHLIKQHNEMIRHAKDAGQEEVATHLEGVVASIHAMFPQLAKAEAAPKVEQPAEPAAKAG